MRCTTSCRLHRTEVVNQNLGNEPVWHASTQEVGATAMRPMGSFAVDAPSMGTNVCYPYRRKWVDPRKVSLPASSAPTSGHNSPRSTPSTPRLVHSSTNSTATTPTFERLTPTYEITPSRNSPLPSNNSLGMPSWSTMDDLDHLAPHQNSLEPGVDHEM